MKKTITLCCVAAFLAGCAPVNRFTRLKKLPRDYSENYQIPGIKAPKSGERKKPWIVWSDREGNAAYANPGGRAKSADAAFREPFLVIGRKGNFLRLIRYKPENIRNDRLAERKKAEYAGWMHSSRLILSPSSITDIQSGLHGKLLTVITDTAAIMRPAAYFTAADSLKVFGDPELQKQTGTTGIHAIVYVLKRSADGRSALVSKTPGITADKAGRQVIGWIPALMLEEIGRQAFSGTPLSGGGAALQKTLEYAPIIRPCHTGSACSFVSGAFAPVIDKTANQVFNIDGKAVSYARGKRLKQELKRINVLFAMERASRLPEQYPMLLNAIQNLGSSFSGVDEPFDYRFAAAVATARGIEAIHLTADYETLTNRLAEMAPRVAVPESAPLPAWEAMRSALALVGNTPETVNLIISVGETGELQENAPSSIVKTLNEKNCRLLGWQLYASNEDKYNNYVLQLSNMIDHYADYRTTNKRNMILYADQFCRSNLLREAGPNFLMLDYPYASMTQGGFLFPEKGETLPMELFAGAVDSIVTQIRADHRLLSESVDRAFATVGNGKDRFDSLLIAAWHLSQGTKPGKEFKEIFGAAAPVWYRETARITVPDSLMRYRLLLSEPELKSAEERLETLCEIEADMKDTAKRKRRKAKDLCRYLERTGNGTDGEVVGRQPEDGAGTETKPVYASTRKLRHHLYDFYMSGLRNCGVCRLKRKEIIRYSLAHAHKRIFGVPSNGKLLEGIAVGELKSPKRLPDAELDALIVYFKSCKEEFSKRFAEKKITSSEQEYYYIDAGILP